VLHPLPPNSGIVFTGISADTSVRAHLDFVTSTGYATSLRNNGMAVATVEHLLATLHSYGITNLLVKVQGEVPVLDGSAIEFCRLIEEAGFRKKRNHGRKISWTGPTGSAPRVDNGSASNRRIIFQCATS
jgi:UDP-3-O-acyl-N-acetylglucosamine deacetylase